MTRVAVVLCGCGRFDGSEIHEAVLSLLHLARGGADWEALAPDRPQWAVCEHFGGEPVAGEERSQLAEAARIARGRVKPLGEARVEDYDALLLPGGSGATRNLADFAERGGAGECIPELAALLRAFHAAGKPIGAVCIAPALVALALGHHRPRLTLGPPDGAAAREAARTGAQMVDCPVDGIVEDPDHRLLSTPAYVIGPGIAEVDAGIGRLVARLLEWCAEGAAAPPR